MIANIIYTLCALTCLTCTWLLFAGYLRSRYRLLLWGGLCFAGLSVNNTLLVFDKLILPSGDLSTWRLMSAVFALSILLIGLIWDTE
jgi:hypothetical protein